MAQNANEGEPTKKGPPIIDTTIYLCGLPGQNAMCPREHKCGLCQEEALPMMKAVIVEEAKCTKPARIRTRKAGRRLETTIHTPSDPNPKKLYIERGLFFEEINGETKPKNVNQAYYNLNNNKKTISF